MSKAPISGDKLYDFLVPIKSPVATRPVKATDNNVKMRVNFGLHMLGPNLNHLKFTLANSRSWSPMRQLFSSWKIIELTFSFLELAGEHRADFVVHYAKYNQTLDTLDDLLAQPTYGRLVEPGPLSVGIQSDWIDFDDHPYLEGITVHNSQCFGLVVSAVVMLKHEVVDPLGLTPQ